MDVKDCFVIMPFSTSQSMYELGVRHTFKKPSVMVKAVGTVIPFDVNDYKVFKYEYTPKGLVELKEHIETVIQDVAQYPNKSDNPVWDFMNIGDFVVDQYKKTENVQKLAALSEEFAGNLERCIEFLEAIKGMQMPSGVLEQSELTEEEEEELRRSVAAFYPNIRNDALTHLRVTRYVSFLDEDWKPLHEIDEFYNWCQACTSNLGLYVLEEVDRKKTSEIEGIIKLGMNIVNKRIQELLELR